MDHRSFDALARSLAAPRTRRGLLGVLAALGGGLIGARPAGAQVTQAQCGNKVCASNPAVCASGCVCCVYANGNSRCRPPQDCAAPGAVACPPGQVLGPSGTCAAPTTTTTTTTSPPNPYGADACAAPTATCTIDSPTCGGRSDCQEYEATSGYCVCAGTGVDRIACDGDGECVLARNCNGVNCLGDPSISCSTNAECEFLGTCQGGICGGQICQTDADCEALGYDVCVVPTGVCNPTYACRQRCSSL